MEMPRQQRFEGKLREVALTPAPYREPMIHTQMDQRDWAILGGLGLIWGSAFLFIGVAVQTVPPLTYVWARLTIAALALWAFLAWRGQRVALPRSAWGAIIVLALINNILPFILFGWGQTQIASGLAAIMNATTPIWGVIAAHLFTADEKITPRKLAGILLGFAGVAVMIGADLLGTIGTDVLAQLACVLASLLYALAGVWSRRFKRLGIAPTAVASGQLTAGALIMLPVALIFDQPWTRALPTLTAIGSIVVLALVCTALGYMLFFRLIASAGATNTLLVTLLVPPVAIALGALVLGETIALQDFGGLALIALGFAAIDGRLFRARARRPLPQAG